MSFSADQVGEVAWTAAYWAAWKAGADPAKAHEIADEASLKWTGAQVAVAFEDVERGRDA